MHVAQAEEDELALMLATAELLPTCAVRSPPTFTATV